MEQLSAEYLASAVPNFGIYVVLSKFLIRDLDPCTQTMGSQHYAPHEIFSWSWTVRGLLILLDIGSTYARPTLLLTSCIISQDVIFTLH